MSGERRRALPVVPSRREFLSDGARALIACAVAGIGGAPAASASPGSPESPGSPGSAAPSGRGRPIAPDRDAIAGPRRATVDVRGLTAPGQSMLASFQGPDGASVLIVRESATRYAALSLLCTHMGCPVGLPIHGTMTCPCHGSQFDLEGRVRRGPAAYPLGRYPTAYDAKRQTVTVTLAAAG